MDHRHVYIRIKMKKTIRRNYRSKYLLPWVSRGLPRYNVKTTTKINKLDITKTKSFYALKDTLKKMRDNAHNKKKLL